MALVGSDVSEERSASIIRETRIGELGTTLIVSSNRSTLRKILIMEAIRSPDTSVLTRATRRRIAENGILHSHSRENFKSYIALTGCDL
jgi:hypothetical protein